MADESWDDFMTEAADVLKPLPEDTYDFVITAAEGKVSAAGNHMIKVSAKVASGPYVNKGIKDFFVIRSASQAKKFVENLKAMGITMDTIAAHKPTMQQLAKVMEGKQFRGKVKHTSSEDFGDAVELSWAMRPPTTGALAVTSFPDLTEGESLGYGSGATVAAADDAAF